MFINYYRTRLVTKACVWHFHLTFIWWRIRRRTNNLSLLMSNIIKYKVRVLKIVLWFHKLIYIGIYISYLPIIWSSLDYERKTNLFVIFKKNTTKEKPKLALNETKKTTLIKTHAMQMKKIIIKDEKRQSRYRHLSLRAIFFETLNLKATAEGK